MAEELRPMHEVVLEELEDYLASSRFLGNKVAFVMIVGRIFRRSKVPEKHLGEVIKRVKKLRAEQDFRLHEHLDGFITELEARQPTTQQTEDTGTTEPVGVAPEPPSSGK